MNIHNIPPVSVDLTLTVSIILGLSAIISPILVALINNHHQYKMKKLEYKQKEHEENILYRRKIFVNFLQAFNKVCQAPSDENISSYSECYSLAYIYLPDYVRKDMGKFNLLINNQNFDEAIKYVDALSMDVCKELQKL